MSRKVKLKSLHVFMAMILLLGLLQPSLALAADSTNVDDSNTEEVIVEEVEGTKEVEEIEETSAENAEESVEAAENSEEEGPEEAEVNTEIEESAEEEDVPTETAESAEEEDASTGTEESVAEIAGLTQSLYNDADIEFTFELRPDRTTQWDLARSGINFVLWGPNGEDATLAIGDETIEFEVRYFHEDVITADLAPGTYDVEVTIGNTTETEQLVVVSNEEFYGDDSSDPLLESRHMVLTKSEAEEIETIRVYADDLYEQTSIDVFVNDVRVESFYHGWGGASADIEVSGLPLGAHTIAFVHPTGIAEMTLIIVPDEQGAPAPAGTYEGTTIQYIGGSHMLDNPFELPIKFEVDEDGTIKNLEVEYWWVCVLADGQSGFSTSVEMPDTQITVNQAFQIDWEEGASPYSLVGIIHEDGTASGTFFNYSGACGMGASEWNLESDTPPVPQPEPEDFEVDLAPDTTEETEGSLTITVATTSDSDITSLKWLTGDRTVADFADAGNEIDLETKSFTVDENGTYTVYALNTDGISAISKIVISNIIDQEPIDPGPTDPVPTDPEPTDPDPTDPEPTDPVPTDPEPTDPDPTDPGPTDPDPTDPEPTDPDPTDPEPTDPDPTDPEPTDPDPTDPEPTDPDPTDPEPTDPDPTDPEPTDPDPTDPEPTDPVPTDPTDPDDGDPSDGTDPGVSIDPDDDADSDDRTDQEVSIETDDDTDAEGNKLPSTSTYLFNLLAIGAIMLVISFALLMFRRKQNV